jgi:hypothetical protein
MRFAFGDGALYTALHRMEESEYVTAVAGVMKTRPERA